MKIQKTIELEVEVKPCLECGSTNIHFYNCGYSSFNVAGAKCKCGNEVKVNNIDWNVPDHELIPYWNEKNDPEIIISKYEREIELLKEKIANCATQSKTSSIHILPSTIDLKAIQNAIKVLTGLSPKVSTTEERYQISLGNNDPFEIGFDKRRNVLEEDVMEFSIHLKLIEEISKFMRDEAQYLIWRSQQK